jgi:nucleotide-binding universal stress UspA family protein
MSLGFFSKILIAFDGSPNSIEASELATILAKGCNSTVTIVHVLPPITILTAPLRQEYETSIENKAKIEALKIESRLKKEGVDAKTRILQASDSIAGSLIDFSNEEKVNLIVAGSRGLGAFKRMVLGSVSTSLLNHATCSVLVFRKGVYQIQPQLRKILVATDGSKNANRAVECAVSVAKFVGAELTIVHVVYMPPIAYGAYVPTMGSILEDLKKDGERIIFEASKIAKESEVEVTTNIINNNHSPVWAITEFADECKFDLIVVGSRGIGGFERIFLGSVANSIAHYATCSVIVTR